MLIINLLFVFLKPVSKFAILHIIPGILTGMIVFWLFRFDNLSGKEFLIPIIYSVVFLIDLLIAYLFMKNRSAEL